MSFFGSTDFSVQVASGRVTGFKPVTVNSINPSVGKIFEDVWDEGGIFVYPTAGETWEIVSSSVNDTSAGTGARTVEITSLDTDYVLQTEIATLNGTTPVTLSNTHFRPRIAIVQTIGSGEVNDGNITIRVSGGGNTRLLIRAGLNNSFSGHYTVPAGTIAIILSLNQFIPKNEDVVIKHQARLVGADKPFLTGSEISIYQTPFDFPNDAKMALPEKTDFKIQVKSTNTAVAVNCVIDIFEDTTTTGVTAISLTSFP